MHELCQNYVIINYLYSANYNLFYLRKKLKIAFLQSLYLINICNPDITALIDKQIIFKDVRRMRKSILRFCLSDFY